MKWGKRVHLIIFVLLCIFFVFFLSRLDLAKALNIFAKIGWSWVILAALLNIFNTWVEALRWKLILSSIKKGARHHIAFEAILVGVVGNVLLPLKVGDVGRAYFISRKEGIHLSSAISSIMLDRMVDITSFLILVAITLSLDLDLQFPVRHINIMVSLVLAIILVIFFVLVRFGTSLKSKLKSKFGLHIAEKIDRFVLGLSALRRTKILLPTIVLSIGCWGMKLGIIWLMFKALHLGLSFFPAIITLILINLGISILGTPANFGGFEFSAVAALRLFSTGNELAVSYALALHLIEVIPIVLMGLIVIWLSRFGLESFKIFSKSAKQKNGETIYDVKQPD